MINLTIEAPSSKDELQIRKLLTLCELPQKDITPEGLHHFLVLKEKEKIIGVVGLEVFGPFGLLRSLAVDPKYRSRGFAPRLIERMEAYAVSLNIEILYLLTMTAEGFFAKYGYQKVERKSAPPVIRGTTEFGSLCPISAVCMVKSLKMKSFQKPSLRFAHK